MIERRYSLREAAKLLGVDRGTLRRWLALDGLRLPRLRRGEKLLLTEAEVERAIQRRQPQIDWSHRRNLRGAA